MTTPTVLVIRHPDDANSYTTTGDVRIISIDLGSEFDGKPYDNETAWTFVGNLDGWLDDVPTGSEVFTETINVVRDAVADFPDAVEYIEQYERRRTPRLPAEPVPTV